MTDSDVGATTITLHLDEARAAGLRHWAKIGRRDLEATVLAAIDEYLMPIETLAHAYLPSDHPRPKPVDGPAPGL